MKRKLSTIGNILPDRNACILTDKTVNVVALEPDQLNDTDEAILDELRKGRVTPQYIADKLEISRPYASEKLRRFVEHRHVNKIASGLYELTEDPREKNGESQD